MSNYRTAYERANQRNRRRKRQATGPIPAPDQLEVIQAFINTRPLGDRPDAFATSHSLSRWLAGHGLLASAVELEEDDRQRALEVRRGLCVLITGNGRTALDPEAIDRLDRAVSSTRFRLRFNADGTSRLESADPGIHEALATLLGIVHIAHLLDTWSRFKLCAAPDCHTAFYDDSKSRRARWCTHRCGDRMRARRRSPRRRSDRGW